MQSKNMITTRPMDVQTDDIFPVKIVAVAGPNNNWYACQGPSAWDDEHVARNGDVLLPSQAKPLFYVMTASGRYYGEL